MRPASLIGTAALCGLLAAVTPLPAQSPWNSVATRGDADRDAQIVRAAHSLYRERDCKGAQRQIRQAADWHEGRPGVDPDPRIPLIAARASACLGDSVTAARNYGIYDALGGNDPDLGQEFGDVCRAVFRPSEMPVDSLEAVQTMRELREDSVRLEGAVARARPGVTRDSVRELRRPEAERTLLIKAGNSIDPDQTVQLNEPPSLRSTVWWRRVGGQATGSRAEATRLSGERERVEAQMSCLRSAW